MGVREQPYRYALRETGRFERRECPSCRAVEPMTIMETVQSPTLEIAIETLYRCPRCQRLAIRPGVTKRVGGLLLLLSLIANCELELLLLLHEQLLELGALGLELSRQVQDLALKIVGQRGEVRL